MGPDVEIGPQELATSPADEGQAGSSWAGCSAVARATAQELRFNPQFMTADEIAVHDGLVTEDSMLLLALKTMSLQVILPPLLLLQQQQLLLLLPQMLLLPLLQS